MLCATVGAQEVEVAAVLGLEDVVHVQARVATGGRRLGRCPGGAAPGELGVVDEQVDAPIEVRPRANP
ncbi:MAG: hypothetical protein DK306_001440 [Chloroflexi bacterium]|nr:MAG: hypothetical protein DK306_001440 [Chloroflexota bacterium]